MPDFLLLGAAKSGTTSLYHYLGQHPEVYTSPVKEPNFFAFEDQDLAFQGPGDDEYILQWSVTSLERYTDLFADADSDQMAGEASWTSLYHPDAPARIHQYCPDAKLIAILRNPIERAHSNYLMLVRSRLEPIHDFATALELEAKRVRKNWSPTWHYTRLGLYHAQLSRYFRRFDSHQIRVYLFEDLVEAPHALLHDIFRFLDIDPHFTPNTSVRYNASGLPQSNILDWLMRNRNPLRAMVHTMLPPTIRKRLGQQLLAWNLTRPPINSTTRNMLIASYRDDILRLQDLIQRDLSHWLEG